MGILIKHFLKCNPDNTQLGQIVAVEDFTGGLKAAVVVAMEGPAYTGYYPVAAVPVGFDRHVWYEWDELLWTRFRISEADVEVATDPDGLSEIQSVAGVPVWEFIQQDANLKAAVEQAPDSVVFRPAIGWSSEIEEVIPEESAVPVQPVSPPEPPFETLFNSGDIEKFVDGLNAISSGLEIVNRKWNTDLVTGEPLQRDPLHMQMLIVSEIAEATEGCRKNMMDDHLPHRKMEEVEMADAIIRIIDYANVRGLDLAGAIMEKIEYNMTRKDHTRESRLAEGGKKV